MAIGLFERLFTYRQRENSTPLENYLTELFAYCLENDLKFRNDFLNRICNLNNEYFINFTVSTQNEYENFGRPDVEIEFENYSILLESKVESSEGLNQIERYSAILNAHKKTSDTKLIIYLTKYFEFKQINCEPNKLVVMRWFEIYDLINQNNNEITIQLKIFLKDNGMNKPLNFDNTDIIALKTVPNTISKMNEVLNRIEQMIKDSFGACSTRASRSSRLESMSYINYVELHYDDLTYWLDIGFNWYDGEPLAWIALEFKSSKFKLTDLKEILDTELIMQNGWTLSPIEDYIYYENFKEISSFNTSTSDNIITITNYFIGQIEILLNIKKRYPKLLNR